MSDDAPVTVDVSAVMTDLQALTVLFPVDAIRTIQAHRELFIPHLIQAIEDACDSWNETGTELDGQAAFFSLFLLTEFSAFEAWPTFRRVLQLKDNGLDELYGDATTECFPRMVALFARGRSDFLDELISDVSLDYLGRMAAARAYQCLVRDQHLTRDAAVEALRRHLKKAMVDRDIELCTMVGCELLDYCPEEAAEEIRTALRENLIKPFYFEEDDLRCALEDGLAGMQAGLLRLDPTGIPDTVAELEWWDGFQEKKEASVSGSSFWDESDDDIGMEDDYESDDEYEAPVEETLIHQLERQMGTIRNTIAKVGRNEPCPCGSGAKYKKCCGKS